MQSEISFLTCLVMYVRLCSEKRSYIKYPAEATPPPKSATGVAEEMQQLRGKQRQRTHPTDSKE